MNTEHLDDLSAKQLISVMRGLGMSQREIGVNSGISQSAVSHIETGRRKHALGTTERELRRACREALSKEKVLA
jgi:transcriptional regulator with XRE-family HTH domain